MTAIPQEGTSSNRYQILGRLAGGGMADIFLARSSNSAGVDRYVVLKRVLQERSKDPHFASMFLDEARLASQLQHPNIAQVHDIGKLGGSYFYTMEYVHGEDLRHVLMRLFALRRAFPVPLALFIASNALAGLHHAHTRVARDGKPLGVVHRDVSPSNVMVSYEGVIKMLDFGVAKATQHSAESRSGTIKGKIAYLSPEQCQGNPIDRRSDIYSLGIVMHEMLTGRRLYKRDTDFATMMSIVQEPVSPPSLQRPDISRELDYLVLTALEKHPDKRFATAADMIEAIEGLATREQHLMSGNALGKFMRELFGDRPEPWLEIQAREEETKAITVTGESVAGLDPLAGAVPISMGAASPSGSHLVAENLTSGELMIQQQLDQAPPLARPERGSDSIPRATPQPNLGPAPLPQAYPIQRADSDGPTADERRPDNPTPSAPMLAATTSLGVAPPLASHSSSQVGVPPMRPSHSSSGMLPMRPSHSSSQPGIAAYPTAPPEMMAEYRSQTNAPILVVPIFRRRSFVIFASALVVVVAILGIMMFAGGGGRTQVAARGSDGTGGSDTGSSTEIANGGSSESGAGANGANGSDTNGSANGAGANGTNGSANGAGANGANGSANGAGANGTNGSANGAGANGANGSANGTEVVMATIDAAVSDATVARVDAGVRHPPIEAGPRSLAELIGAGAFSEVADRCATTTPSSAMDRARCGIAACNLKQKASALNFYNSTAGAAQQLVERACKDKGLVLKPKVINPPKNPCDDKKFREENPLKCQ